MEKRENVNFMEGCENQRWLVVWYGADIFVMVMGVLGNAALLWLFLGEKKSLPAAKILCLNLVVMNFFYLAFTPFRLILYEDSIQRNNSASTNTTERLQRAKDVFDIFNLIGCPMLLTYMCVERYLAVMRPILYLKLRKWEYKAVACGAVWAITISFCVATGILDDHFLMTTAISLVISELFLIMLCCLETIMWSLWQQSPAHTSLPKQRHSKSPRKRQAVLNVLAVVVPSVTAYLPVLMMLPIVLYIYNLDEDTYNNLDPVLCHTFAMSQLTPRMGVLIGPLFYLSKAKQMCCLNQA